MKIAVLILVLLSCLAISKAGTRGAYIANHNTDLVYNNSKDTIHLSKADFNSSQNFLPGLGFYETGTIFKEVQVDGKGAKEVVVYRTFSGSKGAHGGTFDITESTKFGMYEVWDLDNKKLLFKSVNSYQFELKRFMPFYKLSKKEENITYHYNFSIDTSGVIKISYLSQLIDTGDMSVVSNILTVQNSGPDHEEGIYRFIKGKYIRI